MIRFLVAALLVVGIPQPALAASAPTSVSIAAPVDPVALGTTVSVTGAFTDPDSTTHTAMWTWGDGSSSSGQMAHVGDGGTVAGAHGYAQAGVYRVGLDVRDESGATGTAVFEYVVVYDASGGFVTGGGWIDSPPGAYPADPSLVGRANFGLVARYKPGASEPDGTTEFQFHAADLNFHSADYEWLVVSGARAQYKGTGTIQGRSGLFRFIVTAIDGDLLAKGQPDRFRMKILGDRGVVYDNQMGSGDSADPSMILGGGSIVIHKGKGGPQPVNHAPVANAGADVSVTAGQLVTLDGTGSSDPDGDALTYAWTIVSAPVGSTAALVGATTAAPTLTPDRAGAYRVQLVVSDGALFSAPDEVQVNASAPANRAPVAADDEYAATEDTLRTVAAPGVLGNDTDADGDALSAQLVSGPAHGALVLSGSGSFTYTPSLNFNGPDSFTYRASDGTATSGIATVSITVVPVNDAPNAVDDTASTNENTPVTIDILANDSDVDSAIGTLAVSITIGPAHGVASFDALTRRATYTPAPDFSGSDSFTYRICDAEPACDSASVQVSVSDTEHPPVAADDQYAATEDTLRTVTAPGVLGNDTDADGDALSAQLVNGPAHGTLVLSSDGSFTYLPDLNFSGPDGFSYRASDGTLLSAPATVHIDVAPVNDPPTAQDDSAVTPEDTAVQIDVLANDSDVDGTLDEASVAVVLAPTLGTTAVDHTTGKITYTPGADTTGADSFTYRVCDNAGECDMALVTVEIGAANDAPIAVDDAYTTNEDAPLVVAAPGVLLNDDDSDGDALAAALDIGPAHGALTLNSDGSFTYTPQLNFHGSDSFTYHVCDSLLACDTAIVALTVTPVNDPPVADAGADAAIILGQSTTLSGAGSSDIDGDTLGYSWIIVSAPSGSTAVLSSAGTVAPSFTPDRRGTYRFRLTVSDGLAPDSDEVDLTVLGIITLSPDPLNLSTNATGLLTVSIGAPAEADWVVTLVNSDQNLILVPQQVTIPLGQSSTQAEITSFAAAGTAEVTASSTGFVPDTATVNVTLHANTPPDAQDDSASTQEDTPIAIDVLANDTDIDLDLDPASLSASAPLHGTAVVDAVTHRIVYTPQANYNGLDSFGYQICDTSAACDTATVSVSIGAVNDAPAATDDAYVTLEDVVLNVAAPGLLTNDSDIDGDPVMAVLVSGPAHGTLTLAANGSFAYTPNADYSGPDLFTYRASDGTLTSGPATVNLTVVAGNDPPTAQDDSATTPEDTALVVDVLANDTDVDANLDPATLAVTIAPAHGSAAVDSTTHRITYTPQLNFNGSDSITYQVCDSLLACDTATVALTVTPVNDPPTANAGADATIVVGESATLSGAGSSDIDGDTLNYIWTIVSAPSGSTAGLSDPSAMGPSFTPDLRGLYRFRLTVSDGLAPASDEVDLTVLGIITLTPDPLDLQTNATGFLTVGIDAPAETDTVVTLVNSDQNLILVPQQVTIPLGQSSTQAEITSFTLGGTAQITASSTGYVPDTATVNVGERALTLAIQDELVGVGRTTNATVTLSTPAPAGGVVVTLVIADTLKATVAPATVTIAAGATQGTAVITGVAVGTTTLTASAPGYTNAVANVNVTDALISIGFIPEFGPDEVEGVPISLTKPAPPGGLTISLVTSQPGIATVSPTSTVPAGQFLPPTNPQVIGHTLGTTEITATAPGFAPDHRSVIVGLHLSFTPTTLTLGAGTSRDITLHLSATAPIGGLNVQLNMVDPTIASVASTVNIPQGQTSLVVPITGLKNGTTTLRTTSPGIAQATATIVVGAPITIGARSVGKDLQDQLTAALAVPAPAGNLTVTFTSDDPSKLVISSVQTAAGGASATVQVTAGTNVSPAVYLQALAGSGTVKVTASAIGYADGTSNVTLMPSGFYIFAPGIVSTFTTTTFAPNTQIFARSSRLNTNLSLSADQEVRGGLTVGFDIVSSLPSVGTITSSISFAGGTTFQKNTLFDPATSGTTILSFVTPAGFSTPTTFQTVTANVDAPNVMLGATVSVGRDLQTSVTVQLQNAPPAGSPVDVTVTVVPGGEGTVAISKTASAAGTSSVTFTGVTTTIAGTIFVQGLALGTAQLIGSANNYDSGNVTVNVTPSGFYIFAPGIVSSFSTTTFAANTTISLRSSRLTSGLVLAGDQDVRGGITVNVNVTSSQPSVGVIVTSPVVFAGGGGFQHTTPFDPLASGVSTIAYTAPAQFLTATTFQTVTATVDAPDVRINAGALISVGRDLQGTFAVTLESAPPAGSPVDVTVTVVPGGEAFTSIAKTATAVGTNTVTYTGVTTTNVGNLFVKGLALGSAQLTGTATNYNTGTTNVSVTPSGFYIFAPGIVQTFTTNTFAANTTIAVRSVRLNANLTFAADQEVRGGLTVNVPVTSSQPAFGTITTSPVVFAGGNGFEHTTAFDPQTVGTSILSIPSPVPGFSFSVPSNVFQTVTANVRAPEVRFAGLNVSSQRIGRDLQLPVQVSLESAPPQPVDVTLTVVSGGEGITSISKIQTALGTNTLTFTGVTTLTVGTIYIQGRSLGSTAITGIAAGYNDGTANVSVEPSGFYIFAGGGQTSFTTTAGAGNTTLTLRSAALDPVTLNFRQDQEIRGGLSVGVTVTSSNPSAGTITVSPVVFASGQGNKTTAFDPVSAGTSFITIPAPVTGFSIISNLSTTVTATVNP